MRRSIKVTLVARSFVSDVKAGSPADNAGVRRGDVITGIDGAAVKDGNVLRNHVAQLLPGSNVTLTLLRGGKEQTVNVTLAELQAANKGAGSRDSAADPTGYGMSVEPLTPERAKQLGASASAGVVVTGVQPSGRAADAGIRSGDLISEVDGKPVQGADALRSALQAGNRPALLLVHRGGMTVFVTLERGDR